MKKLCAMLFVLLLSAAISGCNSKTEETIPSETIECTTQQTEAKWICFEKLYTAGTINHRQTLQEKACT